MTPAPSTEAAPAAELSFQGASDYLSFARSDLRQGGRRGRINALGNAKRALHAQTDAVLYCAGFWERAQERNWDFRARIDLLTEMKIATPQVLARINRSRNRVEHDYEVPEDTQQLTDFCDAVELFVSASASYASNSYNAALFEREYRGSMRSIEIVFSGNERLEAVVDGSSGLRHIRTRSWKRFRSLQIAVYAAAYRDRVSLTA